MAKIPERSAHELQALLEKAKAAYYHSATPIMSDAEFDRLEDELRELEPEHPYFGLIGAELPISSNEEKTGEPKQITAPDGAKIRHAVAMLSMDKAKQIEGVYAWFERLLEKQVHSGSIGLNRDALLCVQPKIDGISASCRYRNGRLESLATRGDGSLGQNISHIAPFISDIPQNISDLPDDSFEVRGELYVAQNDSSDEQSVGDVNAQNGSIPLRNICAGLINRKQQNAEEFRRLRFVAYQCPSQRLAHSEYRQIQLLASLGFPVVEAHLCQILGLKAYTQRYLEHLRQSWPYETDGLIICLDESRLFAAVDSLWTVSHHHHYAIALKPPAQTGRTLLYGIQWQPGRQGRLTPVAEFLPLRLASAVIERASLHNLANVKAMKSLDFGENTEGLKLGSILEIERAGDVIPYVRGHLGSALQGEKWPLDCYFRDEDIETLQTGKQDNPEQTELAAKTGERVSLEAAAQLQKLWQQKSKRSSLIPEKCPSCGGSLCEGGVDLLCPEPACPEQVVQRILFWIRRAKMEQIAEQGIRELYRKGKLRSLPDLYRLEEADLREVPGYAQKKIARFISERDHSRTLSVGEFVERLGIPLLQQKSLQKLGELRRKSRWDQLLQRTGEKIAPKTDKKADQEASQNTMSLNRAIEESLLEVLPDWNGLSLQKTTEESKAEAGENPSECAARLLALLSADLGSAVLDELWQTKTGRNTLWKTGFAAWEQFLLQGPHPSQGPHPTLGHSNYLELRRLDDFLQFHEPQSRYSVLESVGKWLTENQLLLRELLPVLNLREETDNATKRGEVVCMSGSGPLPRKTLQQQLENAGYVVTSSLTKTTNILLCADPQANSSKLQKARNWGVRICSYREFGCTAEGLVSGQNQGLVK